MGQRGVAVDFDGVLHSYTSGWKGAEIVPDAPVPGGQEFVRDLMYAGYTPVVHSSRASSHAGRDAIVSWLQYHGFPEMHVTQFKPAALVYLDDRAMRFNGRWPSIPEIEVASIPWGKFGG